MFRRLTRLRTQGRSEPEGGDGLLDVPADRWPHERGATRLELSADVIGSFPGFADYAGLIVDATVVLTDRYLLVDEGEPHGFGLARRQIDRARADDAELRVGYRQSGDRRSFLLRVRRSRKAARPRAAAAELLAALRAGDVAADFPPLRESHAVALSWEDATAVEHERVRWTGRVTAPIAVGQECTPCDVWVSLESLLWTSPRSLGVNRVALGEILSLSQAEIADADRSPAVYVTIGDDSAGRIDLPFVFNLAGTPAADAQSLADFHRTIRGERLPEVGPPPRLQPWLRSGDQGDQPDATRATPHLAPDDATRDALDDGEPATDEPPAEPAVATEGGTDIVPPEDAPAFTSWPRTTPERRLLGASSRREPGERAGGGIAARRWRHTRGVDGVVLPEPTVDGLPDDVVAEPYQQDLVLAEWSTTEPSDAYAAWPGVDVAVDEQPAPAPAAPTTTAVPAYELAATATIDAVLFVISRRVEGNSAPPLTTVPPSSGEQAAALSELMELTAAGVITPEEARARKARLIGVGEASVRLRTLLELSSAGHLSLTELLKKRDTILKGIDYPVEREG